ncbi:hypothetical protein MMC19_001581 [Ptychographa xylographoides]|nr:hypothetical protein [Ptychographa xylographoides]
MTDLRQLRKRRDAGPAAKPRATAPPDIPLSIPNRGAPKGKTLFDIAAERQAELQGGQPFAKTASSARAEPSDVTTTTINEDGNLSVSDEDAPVLEPIGPFGQAVFFAVTLTMLHFTLDVLVHQQYRQSIDWGMIAQRTLIALPTLVTIVAALHARAASLWAQVLFFALSVGAGCHLVYASNEERYFAVMRRAPPLGTLWVWSVIEMRLEVALASVVAVVGYFWWGHYSIF